MGRFRSFLSGYCLRTGLVALLLASLALPAAAQTDILPSSVDVRLVQGSASDQLLVQVKLHSAGTFGGILSAMTVTIRYDASAGGTLGGGATFCNAWSSFPPSSVVVNSGTAYRTYNGFGLNRLEDPAFDGGCAMSLPVETWFTITTIPVGGTGCTAFTLGNDAFTGSDNRDFYISMNGQDVTGQVVGGPVSGGNCAEDCLGMIGGTALPGTACDDGNAGTTNDTWNASCVCIGTPTCTGAAISGTTSNSPICSSSTLNLGVTATGTGPLSYAWSGTGTFSPNASSQNVSVTGAATGNYQVVVTNACGTASSSVPVVVNTAPSATISYSGSPYCTSGGTATVTRTGSTGGTYSATPSGLSISSSTGAITLGTSTAGSYTVTYSIAAGGGCSAFSTTASVVINTAPSATISYAGSPYCTSGGTATVTRTGSTGGTYSAVPSGLSINPNTGAIGLAGSTAATYTVTYTIGATGGCSAFATTATIQIGQAPTATIDYPGSPYCTSGGQAAVSLAGASGGAFTASPGGLSIDAGTGAVDLNASTTGTYTVTYTIAPTGGCAEFSTTAEISVGAAPSATITYTGSPFCASAGQADVTRTGSSGGAFSATPSGLSIDVGTGHVDLTSSAPGMYTVTYAIAAAGGCSAFSTTTDISIGAAPSATINYSGSPYCTSGVSAAVSRTGTPGGTFSSAPAGLSINAANGAIDLGNSSAGIYTVTYAIAAGGGCTAFSTTAQVVVNEAPSSTISYTGSPYCTDGGTASVVRTGTTGGTYLADPAGLSIDLASGAIDLGSSSAGTYTVTYGIAANGGCAAFNTTASVIVGAAPSASISYDGSPYCSGGGSVDVTRTGTAGGTYAAVPGGLSISASTGQIDLGASTAGTYTVTYSIAASGGCALFTTSAPLVIGTAPSAMIEYNGSPYCTSDVSVNVTRTGSGGGVYSSVPSGLSLNATTGSIDPGASTAGNFTVTYDIAASGGCASFSTTADVVIDEASTWYADADADGAGDPAVTTLACDQPTGYVAVAGDLCPSDPNKVDPGTCGCGVPDTDTDHDGVPDCIDSCPLLSGGVGDACDDGDVNTTNDQITSDCECVGTVVYDCPVLMANIGDACDDGDVNTTNDQITSDCECVGTVVYDCPVLMANIGDVCDDGDMNTTNDQITADCDCIGTVICVPPSISETSSDSPICSGTVLNLGVTAGGTGTLSYAWSGAGLFDPGPLSQYVAVTGAATGDYQVTVSNNCGSASATVSVVVDAAPSATISFDGSPYCTTSGFAQVTRLGTPDGSYSAAPAGLAIDPGTGSVDLDASTAGTYVVTYSIDANGGCGPFSTTTDILVQDPTVWYADVDGDGVGSDADAVLACEQPSGYVAISGDACPTDPDKLDPGICGCGIPDTDTDNDGAADCIDGCPTDPDKIAPGACGCGVPDTDSDGDGIADCIDSCPTLSGQIGDACDDNDPGTEDDVITSDCVCAGTIVYDCPDLQANVGDACDDGDATTTNDMVTADCACVGTSIYDCPDLQANVGDACDDGDATTENDMVTADCACVGTSIYDCPDLQANIGDVCDDGNAGTDEDVITEDCICLGDIIDGIGDPIGSSDDAMSLFPNPNRTGVVTLHIEGLGQGQRAVLIEIHDASGRLVYQETAQAVGGVVHHGMDLSKRVSQGLYMVEAIAGGRHYLRRLVIQ